MIVFIWIINGYQSHTRSIRSFGILYMINKTCIPIFIDRNHWIRSGCNTKIYQMIVKLFSITFWSESQNHIISIIHPDLHSRATIDLIIGKFQMLVLLEKERDITIFCLINKIMKNISSLKIRKKFLDSFRFFEREVCIWILQFPRKSMYRRYVSSTKRSLLIVKTF